MTFSLAMIVYQIVLEADGYQPYLISPEKGLRSLIKGVLELAKEPSRLCVDEVNLDSSCFCCSMSLNFLYFTVLNYTEGYC